MGESAVPIIADSGQAIKELTRHWAKVSGSIDRDTRPYYLIVTLEQTSGVAYAPISNFTKELLASLDPEYADDLVGGIREDVQFPLGKRGPIRDLLQALRSSVPANHVLLLSLRLANGVLKADMCGVYSDQGELISDSSDEAQKLVKSARMNWAPYADRLAGLLGGEANVAGTAYVSLRAQERFESEPRSLRASALDLVQVGIVLGGLDVTVEDVARCSGRISVLSGLAASAALYEKERYYERAARQCSSDSVVKYGRWQEMKDQFRRLEEIGMQSIHIPVLDKVRSDSSLAIQDDPGKSEVDSLSWYRMSWFEMAPLAETLVWKGGLRKYELGALMRASLGHLRHAYWGTTEAKRREVRPAVMTSMFMAKAEALHFAEQAREILLHLDRDWPLKDHREIVVLKPDLGIKRLLQQFVEAAEIRLSLEWYGAPVWAGTVRSPFLGLERLCQLVCDEKLLGGACELLQGRDTHGDAHFMNLLVDSSVPEDPLLVSIDPRCWPSDGKGFTLDSQFKQDGVKFGVSESALKETLGGIGYDPAFDVATFVAATSGLHSLIIRRGLEMDLGQNEGPVTLHEARGSVRRHDDGGGISSAKLVRISSGVPKNALPDLGVCADAILRDFQEMYRRDSATRRDALSINVALARMWGLVVRKLLSTARAMLVKDATQGAIVYLVVSAYVERGIGELETAFRLRLDGDVARDHLLRALAWPGLAVNIE